MLTHVIARLCDQVCFIKAADVGGEYDRLLDQERRRYAAVRDDEQRSMDSNEDKPMLEDGGGAQQSVPFDLLRGFVTEVSSPSVGISLMTLSNGVRVTLKRTEFDKAQCSVCVHASGGIALEEPGRPGDSQI